MARRLCGALGGGISRPRCGLNLPRSWPRRTLSALAPSAWHATAPLPADPILGLVAAFKEDTAPQKVNLAQGAYRTDAGTPFVLASVKEAERRVAADLRDGRSDKDPRTSAVRHPSESLCCSSLCCSSLCCSRLGGCSSRRCSPRGLRARFVRLEARWWTTRAARSPRTGAAHGAEDGRGASRERVRASDHEGAHREGAEVLTH